MQKKKSTCRILIVEDNVERTELLKTWLPKDIVPVVAKSAGSAIGMIRRDKGYVYAGLMLDHDLQENIVTQADISLNGMNVVDAIIRYIPIDIPIFIHSTNVSQGPAIAKRLEKYNYFTMQISMNQLTKRILRKWLDEVKELWEDLQEKIGYE